MKYAWLAVCLVAALSPLAQGSVVFNASPTLGWTAGTADTFGSSPITVNSTWTNKPVSWVLIDQLISDRNQSGTVSVKTSPTGAWQADTTWATTTTTGDWVAKAVSLNTAGTYGVQMTSNQAVGKERATVYRIYHADFLENDPGENLALTGTAIGTGTGAALLTDQLIAPAARWRANAAAAENYCGFTFAEPTSVAAFRVTNGISNGATYRWTNYHVQVLNPDTGVWDDLGAANQTGNYYWVDLGGMSVSGIRLYGSTALGNNPVASGGLIVDEMQIYAGAVPEPMTLSLLAIGGVGALLRRRNKA